MEKIFFIIVFLLSCQLQILVATQMNYSKLKQFREQIIHVLVQEIEKRTTRKNVQLEILSQNEKNSIRLFPSQRSERDSIFFLTATKKGSLYQVVLRVMTQSEKRKLQPILENFFHHSKVEYQYLVGNIGVGVVSVVCADLYVKPILKKGGNLASQLLHGTPVTIWEAKGSFYRVQGCLDGYFGWLPKSSFQILEQKQWENWCGLPKIYPSCFVHSLWPASTLALHDGKVKIFGKKINSKMTHHISYHSCNTMATSLAIICTAKQFLPNAEFACKKYLWGGTHSSHLDCSGFVQTVYRMHNILLPRDADQQYQISQRIGRNKMQPADLIFFSKRHDRPTHIGIYLGNGKFIHCSPSGSYSGVKVSNLNGKNLYDRYLNKIYFGAGRILTGTSK